MYRALTATEAPLNSDELRGDLESIGIHVVDVNTDASQLAQAVVKHTPDLVIVGSTSPSDHLFKAAQTLSTLAPCPFIVFTSDGDSAKIERASDSGIHAYVVEGYAKHRLLPIILVARARFKREQLLKNELNDLAQRYEERKQIDRAKALLMRSRGVTEDAAFDLLRNLAMNSRQRMGAVALRVIDLSRAGEAVNKAGQLRMLSQRVVRCYVQSLLGIQEAEAARVISESIGRVDSNFTLLRTAITAPGYADNVERTLSCWQEVAALLVQEPSADRVDVLDAKADAMLKSAEALTEFLEASGLVASLRVLNISGRQRMLSQRIAKVCFLLALQPSGQRLSTLRELAAAFQAAMDQLHAVPVSSSAISQSLKFAMEQWTQMREFLGSLHDASVLIEISELSEKLLATMEGLTLEYERAMQLIVGDRLGRLR